MVIIIEGPDGSGKSTLAKELAKALDYNIIHMSNPKTQEEKDNMFKVYTQMVCDEGNVIWDRCWYSEMVYGPIFRNESIISTSDMFYLEKRIADMHGGLLIHCTDKIETLWGRCQRRGEDFVLSRDVLDQIKQNFQVVMDMEHALPVVTYTVLHPNEPL